MRPDPAVHLLGTPLVVSGFMAGRQQANPVDVQTWARELAHLLVRIHAIRPTARQRLLRGHRGAGAEPGILGAGVRRETPTRPGAVDSGVAADGGSGGDG